MVLEIHPSIAAPRHFAPPPRVVPIGETENDSLLETAERVVAIAEDECRSVFFCCCPSENLAATRPESQHQEP